MAMQFLDIQMGKQAKLSAISEAPLSLTKDESDKAQKRFKKLDTDNKGFITINDLRRHFKVCQICLSSSKVKISCTVCKIYFI